MASSGAASGALFNQGVANGMQARRQREARMEFERTRPQRDAEAEIELRRRNAVAQELESNIQIRKAEAANFVEAERAFELYTGAIDQLDWGDPDAAKSYATVTRQYLPTVLKHESTARKWRALDQVTKQGQAFTLQRVDEANVIAAIQEASSEGIIDIPRDPTTGSLDRTALQEMIDRRRQEKFDQAVRLRATPYGRSGTRTPAKLGPGTAAVLEALTGQLRDMDKEIATIRVKVAARGEKGLVENQKALSEMQRRRESLVRAIESYDSKVSPEPEPSEPASASITAESGPRGGPAAPTAPGSEGQDELEGYGVFDYKDYNVYFKEP